MLSVRKFIPFRKGGLCEQKKLNLKKPLNKSSAAEKLIFFSIRIVSKAGNTSSIPSFLKLSAEDKALPIYSELP